MSPPGAVARIVNKGRETLCVSRVLSAGINLSGRCNQVQRMACTSKIDAVHTRCRRLGRPTHTPPGPPMDLANMREQGGGNEVLPALHGSIT
jgi:hypothetical protein